MKKCIFLTLFVLLFLLDDLAVGENICSPICTMEYNPVCAGDGVSKPVTFGNPCEFKYHNCVNPDKPFGPGTHPSCQHLTSNQQQLENQTAYVVTNAIVVSS